MVNPRHGMGFRRASVPATLEVPKDVAIIPESGYDCRYRLFLTLNDWQDVTLRLSLRLRADTWSYAQPRSTTTGFDLIDRLLDQIYIQLQRATTGYEERQFANLLAVDSG